MGTLAAASQVFGGALAFDNKKLVVARASPKQPPVATPAFGSITSQGCFSSKGNMTTAKLEASTVSSGSCNDYCKDNDYWVFGLSGQSCLCGMAYPPKADLSKDENCNFACPAYPLEACGGIGDPSYFSVYNLGEEVNVPYYKEETKSTASSSASGPTSTAAEAAPSDTAAESSTPEEDDEDKDSGGGGSVAGIVAGSVVGVLAVAGLFGGLWFFMRRRRNTEIEEEHRRNAAVNAFISGSKPPGSSGSISMTDSRLDPVMAHRRLSDGSIADNEDYSRKILRVRGRWHWHNDNSQLIRYRLPTHELSNRRHDERTTHLTSLTIRHTPLNTTFTPIIGIHGVFGMIAQARWLVDQSTA